MNPNHYLAVAIEYLFGGARPGWPAAARIGKTLVSSSMIDRVAARLGRELVEVPVGFKWFVPGPDRRLVRLRRRGVGRRVVPAPRRHGVDHRQGRHHPGPAGLRDPGVDRAQSPREHYADLVAAARRPGVRPHRRPGQPRAEGRRSPRCRPTTSPRPTLAGEPITAKLTEAPGNGAKIGGLKVTTESAWFAARPSGTEDVYKIYAESFRGPEHLAQVQDEAREVVGAGPRGAESAGVFGRRRRLEPRDALRPRPTRRDLAGRRRSPTPASAPSARLAVRPAAGPAAGRATGRRCRLAA